MAATLTLPALMARLVATGGGVTAIRYRGLAITFGALEVAGPGRMAGYHQDPAATAAALTPDGFVRTGDLGTLRGDGSFVFLARAGDALRLGGFLVSPAEIEGRIQDHAAVDGCQVVGADDAGGQCAVAFVTPRPGAGFDAGALAAWCREGLARYKVPARIIPLAAFPTTDSPKVQRARLREMAAAALSA